MKPGSYQARIVDYGITPNKNGASAFIKFNVPGEGEISWFGSLNGGAFNITFGALLECGFESDNPLDLASKNDALIKDEDIPIYVDFEVNHLGKEVLRVKRVGEGGQIKRLEGESLAKLINADKMKIAAQELKKNKKPRARKNQDDPIPF